MGRPKLNMTPDEREVHDRNEATQRKQKQRANESKTKALNGQLSDAEIDELINILFAQPLGEAALMLAELERCYKKQYGIEIPGLRERSFAGFRSEDKTPEEYNLRHNRAKKLGLIRYFAMDAIHRHKLRERRERFELNEISKAAANGLNLEVFRKHKKSLGLIAKMDKIISDRNSAYPSSIPKHFT